MTKGEQVATEEQLKDQMVNAVTIGQMLFPPSVAGDGKPVIKAPLHRVGFELHEDGVVTELTYEQAVARIKEWHGRRQSLGNPPAR